MPKRAPRGRGSVFQDKARGRWVAQIDIDGRRHRRVRATRNDAHEALDAILGNARMGLDLNVKPTLEVYLREWLDSQRVRPITLRGYRSKLELHVIPHIGKVRLDKLRPSTLERLFIDLGKQGLGPRTTSHVRAVLRNALGRAERHGLIARNVAALTEAVPVPNKERRVLTMDEARQLAFALEGHRLEACYAIAMTLGLRQGEVLGLRWGDVDGGGPSPDQEIEARAPRRVATNRDASTIHVRQVLSRVKGGFVFSEPKTPRSRRDVPLTDSIADLLSRRRVEAKAELLSSGARPPHDLVFTTRRGEPLIGTNVTRELQRVLREAGLPKVTYHDLRHVAASNLAARGFTLREVQAILGHASVRTTSDLYTHVDETDVAQRMRSVAW